MSVAPRPGAVSVLTLSTIAFTLMFAVWLMFGILGIPIRDEFGLSDVQLSWLTAVAVLNGSIWRLPAGIITDRFGGRRVFAVMLLMAAVPTFLVSFAHDYGVLLVLAFFVGIAGNSFSAGVSWNNAWWPDARKGFALGVFGAGNVGASATKLIGPGLIAATAGSTYLGWIVGGWRLVPVLYAALLVIMAVLVWFLAPRPDLLPGQGRSLRSQLRPLKHLRVWRFSLYYVVVFGAYVALSAWLPLYYVDNYGLDLAVAALLTASFIFPASLLRPLGGWFSDRFGARRVMYATFTVMLAVLFFLSLPSGHLVVQTVDGSATALPFTMPLAAFASLVFVLGCAMGVGKAAVYKHIPDYFPADVGSVGGLVGMLGGLGGFILPPVFAYTLALTGLPTSTFAILFVLTAACAVWMHLTVWRMLHRHSPQLAGRLESGELAG
ncbi:nitrate/nitrite transporter [Microbacterium sp. ISL-59]|uniref:MFS transporter n=1 Tax=Microbacterium sp. ISL-59 TaxID=2819159 RepID=UPI0027E17151|nr:nitrate/nitrite transporter [Microbacterium sp. ISL-59]